MIDVEKTIISQYSASARIVSMIRGMNACLDPRADFESFLNMVWNVDTAQGFGLDIWGRIVDIPRTVELTVLTPHMGFATGFTPYNEAPFYDGSAPGSTTYVLADPAYRALILMKALANITATNAPSINRLLRNYFGTRGNAYVLDLGDMAMSYVFDFYLEPFEEAIFQQTDVLPRPAGVLVSFSATATNKTFGFDEMGLGAYPFNEGTYAA